ncbi:hypothetical protein [Neptunomonas sp.]|uniref:hypothetical protein n=1 Tax=Neptunomonas sp. TaxID=1971898 RepID=UPI0035623021
MLRKIPSGLSSEMPAKAFIEPTAIACSYVIIEDNIFVVTYAAIRAGEVDANGNMEPVIIRKLVKKIFRRYGAGRLSFQH